ncbi:MAG: AAA family ATPase [Oscillospiraceae bacterium]
MQELKKDTRYIEAISLMPSHIKTMLLLVPNELTFSVHEIRLHIGSPPGLWTSSGYSFVSEKGMLTKQPMQNCPPVTSSDILQVFQALCRYSVHTHQHEISQGFISIAGGHRAGIGGTAVYKDDTIASIKDITSINLRIARQVIGCATQLIHNIFSQKLCSVILAGAPSTGKTTMLRDIAKQLSEGKLGECVKVSVVDERCEIAAVYMGNAGNSLGPACDILSGYAKADGILQAIRTLSPQVIICDEIGTERELIAVQDSFNSGVNIITSIHADNLDDLKKKPQGRRLLATGEFEKLVFLDRNTVGQVREIVNINGQVKECD